jgi:hypothetical protein
MPTITKGTASLVLAALLSSSACGGETEEPGPAPGTLVQRFTIEGGEDATRCPFYDAERIRVVVRDLEGNERAVETEGCLFFRVRVVLPPGRYRATAALVNGVHEPVSITEELAPFDILSDAPTFPPAIDFAPADFGSVLGT